MTKRPMMDHHWCLDDMGIPYEEPDLIKWASWMAKADRHIAKTTIGRYWVSTVFLGLEYGWGNSVPLLYETMVFDNESDQRASDLECRRYATRSEALIGHNEIVKGLEKLIAKTDRLLKGSTDVKQGNT